MIDLVAKSNCPGWAEAEEHLSRCDPVLAGIIARVGPCTLSRRAGYFASLCQSIIAQQISTPVAVKIFRRFCRLFPTGRPTPAHALTLDDATLRAAGLGTQKASFLRSLASAFATGQVRARRLRFLSDEEVIQALIPVRGIGRWTAEMFLLFVLNRTDLLPVDDLGLCKSVQHWYGLKAYPTPKVLQALAEPWRPYRSIATWYLWRVAWKEAAKKEAAKKEARARQEAPEG